MRPGQQSKRSRGRNSRKNANPLSRTYESNGPDVKVRGNASHIADKYVQLARDATASGDLIMAENYFQHAEHYFRVISAAQTQFQQQQQRAEQSQDEDRSEAGDGGGDGQFHSGERMNGEVRDTQPVAAEKPAGADNADGKTAQDAGSAGGARRPRRRNARADAPADPNLASAPQPSINGSSGEETDTSTDNTPAEDETAAAK